MDEERQKRIEAAAKILAARLATPEGQASMKAANEASLKRTQERIAASRMPEELWSRRVGTIYDPPIPAKKEKQRPYARSWTHESVQDLVASWNAPDYKGDAEEVQWDEAAETREFYAKMPGDETPHPLAATAQNPCPELSIQEMARRLRAGSFEDPEIARKVGTYLGMVARVIDATDNDGGGVGRRNNPLYDLDNHVPFFEREGYEPPASKFRSVGAMLMGVEEPDE